MTGTNLAADLRTRGCAICNHVTKAARDFFAHWQYALLSEEVAQEKFAIELGFCPRHAWQLHSMSSAWGESVGLRALTERISQLLAKTESNGIGSLNVEQILRSPEDCRVCSVLKKTEAVYIERVVAFISDKQGAQYYERSGGVCLRHLARMLAIASKPICELLLITASRRFDKLAQQMRDYAAKRKAVRRDLISADEEDASLRALIHIVGAEEYFAP